MTEVFFNGPAGRMEARYTAGKAPDSPVALILHPNPQLGGTMNNKVVYALYKAFANLGFAVLRFNYRGVGKSFGVFDGDPTNDMADTLAALDWLKKMSPDTFNCWIAGYSSGAWTGCQVLMRRPDITGFVTVSPPAGACDFSFLTPCPANGLIIQGSADSVVNAADVRVLAERLDLSRHVQVQYVEIAGADHLYTGHLKEIFDTIQRYVPQMLLARSKRKERARKRTSSPDSAPKLSK